jgi:hypothetical protein
MRNHYREESYMRVFLLRILISWWMISFTWSFGWLLAWLLFGKEPATEMCVEITRAVWFGDA